MLQRPCGETEEVNKRHAKKAVSGWLDRWWEKEEAKNEEDSPKVGAQY
jgi:hypothetical protein